MPTPEIEAGIQALGMTWLRIISGIASFIFLTIAIFQMIGGARRASKLDAADADEKTVGRAWVRTIVVSLSLAMFVGLALLAALGPSLDNPLVRVPLSIVNWLLGFFGISLF